MSTTIDKITRKWIRNRSDELAVEHGYRFDPTRGTNGERTGICDFIEDNLRLYEGDSAGQLVELMPWQRELLMRIFCWVRFSKEWAREVRRFRKASVFFPKKQGKSPTAAMVGLYLLCGDGEQGQKVFSAAKDGKQAGIMHAHARMMVEQSPRLRSECVINKSTGRIAHVPTNSFYDVLAGDNIQGQEGLNGSIIVDETHVVDARLAKTIEYAGASRSEPLQFEVSTAGDNPQGYGKRQYDYGKSVERGDVVDDGFFFQCHEAPQDATDAQLGDPKIWKAANPSWGYTIHEQEFRSSYERAKQSPQALADFAMYRLNVWQRSSNPWLSRDAWGNCQREFTADSLAGRDCYAGLDLSRTKDMTALVLVFRGDDEGVFIQLPFFWLPEAQAEKQRHQVSYIDWARAGHLTLTEGNVVDYTHVERDIGELAEQYNILQLFYDPMYAEELTQRLEANHRITREMFKQTIMTFAGPTAEYERLVIAGDLHHPGNPVLSWQAGHVTCKKDLNNNKRPIKPDESWKKIDGIVAGIMGLAGALQNEGGSYYDTHLPMFIG